MNPSGRPLDDLQADRLSLARLQVLTRLPL